MQTEKFIIKGGKRLVGEISVGGAKNVALKAIVAACLTEEEVVIKNIPLISDFMIMADIVKELGGEVRIKDHDAYVKIEKFKTSKISLEKAAEIRTSSMLIVPLLLRTGKAIIPNPGGCRIGARPIDRIIEGLKKMKVQIVYESKDGYFHAKVSDEGLRGTNYRFVKPTHTGTETLIMAASLAKGRTILENAALEPEIDELINFLNSMGAEIKRDGGKRIVIDGVEKLNGAVFEVGTDRNQIITIAIAAIITGGDVFIRNISKNGLVEFLEKLKDVGGGYEIKANGIRFYAKKNLIASDIVTSPYPGFMTDWQGPWTVLMTQAKGNSTVHEAVYENRFTYVEELRKMGADIELFNPEVKDPQNFYNFNLSDDKKEYKHAAMIKGPNQLHNGVITMTDLRAGATLVLAALAAKGGESVIFGINHLDRGYENFEKSLTKLGANIVRVKE